MQVCGLLAACAGRDPRATSGPNVLLPGDSVHEFHHRMPDTGRGRSRRATGRPGGGRLRFRRARARTPPDRPPRRCRARRRSGRNPRHRARRQRKRPRSTARRSERREARLPPQHVHTDARDSQNMRRGRSTFSEPRHRARSRRASGGPQPVSTSGVARRASSDVVSVGVPCGGRSRTFESCRAHLAMPVLRASSVRSG